MFPDDRRGGGSRRATDTPPSHEGRHGEGAQGTAILTRDAVSTIVAHTHPFVIGVDTHARTHTYAVLTAAGEHLGTETFPNTPAGRSRAISWARRRTSGVADALWVIEGVGSFGAQLARNVIDTG